MRGRFAKPFWPGRQDGIVFVRGPTQPIRRKTDVHAAIVARFVLVSANGLPIRQLKAPRSVRPTIEVVDEAGTIAAGQIPGDARIFPMNAIGRFRVPDGRTAVVPDPKLLRLTVPNNRDVRLCHSEGLAVQDGPWESLRRTDLSCEAIDLVDDFVVQKKLGADEFCGTSIRSGKMVTPGSLRRRSLKCDKRQNE